MAMIDQIPESVIATIRRVSLSGITTGRDCHPSERAYLDRCSHFHWRTGTMVMFTRDTGHHSSGWMKNPDFERCRHLSLSFRTPFPSSPADGLARVRRLGWAIQRMGWHIEPVPFDAAIASLWVKALHGDDARLAWEEGPFSVEGRALGVRHYRVFCDPGWQAIKPRGEVYSTELTELGWRSWSDRQGEEKSWVDAE